MNMLSRSDRPMASLELPDRPLETSDCLRLSVLGAAAERSGPLDDIVERARHLAMPEWTPDAQVLADDLLACLELGLLAPDLTVLDGAHALRVTSRGLGCMTALLIRPFPSCASLGRVCAALKITLAHQMTPDQRRPVLYDVRQFLEAARRSLVTCCGDCRSASRPTPTWARLEADRLAFSISWIDSLDRPHPARG